jgi:hypothetical protein
VSQTQQPVWSVNPSAESVSGGTISRVKVIYEGETVDADEMEFKAVSEAPISYRLNDGTLIEIKHEVKKVFRLCDKKKADGSPIYLLNGTAQVRTEAPTDTTNVSKEEHEN